MQDLFYNTDIEKSLAKDKMIVFRVSESKKDEIKTIASNLNMSMSEYLTSLHDLAIKQIRK